MTAATTPRRRWFSYSLRTLLAAMTVLALWLGWWANSAQQQRAAVAAIEKHCRHNRCEYDYECAQIMISPFVSGTFAKPEEPTSWVPRFLRDALGKDYFHSVESVVFGEPSDDGSSPDKDRAAWQALAGLRNLRQLTSYIQPLDEDLTHVAGLGRLTRLDLMNCPGLTDAALRAIGRTSSLEAVTLSGGQFTPAGFAKLAPLRRLKNLGLALRPPGIVAFDPSYTVEVTDEDLEQIGKLTRLEELSVNSDKVTDAGMAHLAMLGHLKHIEITSNHLTGEGFEPFSGPGSLEDVRLHCPRLSDEGLRFIARLSRLRVLEVSDVQIDMNGLRYFPASAKLESVYLQGPNVGDEAIGYVARFSDLRNLQLVGTRVTAGGLEQLQSARSLRQIGLRPATTGDTKHLKQVLPNCAILNGGRGL